MIRYGPLDIRRELQRIGVDSEQMPVFATTGDVNLEDVLAWLRGLPTGIGHDGFLAALRNTPPRKGLADQGIPARDPTFSSPEIDGLQDFVAEVDRVLPSQMQREGWLVRDKIDYAAAAARLRLLPDGAGWEAISAIVPTFGRVSES